MKAEKLFQEEINPESSAPTKQGPPNRMNDLPYKEWMKFQKSFFRHESSQLLVEECIYFFTKSVWPDNTPSKSLVVGFRDFDAGLIPAPREVESFENPKSLRDLTSRLSKLAEAKSKYDFVLVDLRRYITNTVSLGMFLNDHSEEIFKAIRTLLVPLRYCGVLVGMEGKGGGGFPLPWGVALSSRDQLKLRDEKIGLVESEGSLFYCLFMQADEDQRPATYLGPDTIRLAKSNQEIRGWTIPKPPPRKKNEILHPAKYPETLVAEFIEQFTKPGDTVFDPMAGTGSTVVAAVREGRNGYGADLISEFVHIARERVADEYPSLLFQEQQSPISLVVQGDSTRLNEISELSNVQFDYTITSPPYWSMLSNPGSENQEARRQKNLPLVYSENENDLGNVQDYDRFLDLLEKVYNQVVAKLVENGCLTVVVKNVKRNHTIYPLAWDLVVRLCGERGEYDYLGTTLWCQDDVGLKPFAVGIHWVSNILHHYCLHFKKRAT